MKPYYPALVDLLKAASPTGGSLLEIGCGEGAFMAYAKRNGLQFRGYDVHQHAGLDGGRAARLSRNLAAAGISPSSAAFIDSHEPIPAESETIDVALSIQVLEHVSDLAGLFREVHRVLKAGGTAIHYFPTRRILVDPHSGVPFCHWSKKWRRVFLRAGALLGKYPSYRRDRGYSRGQFVDEFDRYLERFVHYRSISEISALSEACGLTGHITGLSATGLGSRLQSFSQLFTSVLLVQGKRRV